MKYFFSSTSYDGPKVYQALIGATRQHAEELTGQKLTVISTDSLSIRQGRSIKDYLFLIKVILTGKLFSNDIVHVKYRGYSVGRYAVPAALRDYECLQNKRRYYRRLMKSLVSGARLIDGVIPYCDDIEAAYIEHGCYINGVLFEVFSERGIPVYHDHYPYNLVRWIGKGKQGFEDAIKLPHSDRPEDILAGKNALDEVLKDPSRIPYMNAPYEERIPEKLDYDYIVYCHSFTDAQIGYGYDGAFKSVYEWMEFTLECLKDKKVCLKAHPNFYAKGYQSEVTEWDKKIFDSLTEKYKTKPNVIILDYPFKNNSLLNLVNKKTTLVSHHGNALLEGGALGFKCISSKATTWCKYNIFNVWNDKREYGKLLSMENDSLASTNMTELYAFYGRLHDENAGIFGHNNIGRVMSEAVGFSLAEFIRSPNLFNNITDEELSSVIKKLKMLVVEIKVEEFPQMTA